MRFPDGVAECMKMIEDLKKRVAKLEAHQATLVTKADVEKLEEERRNAEWERYMGDDL